MNTAKNQLFKALTLETAPESAKPLLEKVKMNMGFLPNLVAKMSNSPTLLHGYLAANGAFSKGTFSGTERQLILLAASVENECQYCIAAHATVAKRFGAQADVVAAAKQGSASGDRKLDALVALTREMTREHGNVRAEIVDDFLQAGYSKQQILEVLLGIAIKTISNSLDHLSHTELDKQFEAERF